MIKIIKDAPENVAAFKASGEVTKEDFEKVFSHVQAKISQEGELNYLLKLKTDVSNFTVGAWLQDILLGMKHLDKWNRCAIVSDKNLIHQVTSLMNHFTIGEFRAFSHEEYNKALNWVSGRKKSAKQNHSNIGAALISGIGGAVALNVVHEVIRKNFDGAPEVNEVGEEAIDKVLTEKGIELNDKQLYSAALAGDIVSNGLYYSALATNKGGIVSGIAGGLGAVFLPKYLGLNDAPVASTNTKKLMTVAYYTLGAAVTGIIYKKLTKK